MKNYSTTFQLQSWICCLLYLVFPIFPRVGHLAHAFASTRILRPLVPATSTSALSMANLPKLDKWKSLRNGSIEGQISAHPTIPDGSVITTSPVERTYQVGGKKCVATYTGSKYQLGDPIMVTKPLANGKEETLSMQQLQARARKEYNLSGDIIGDDENLYLLCGVPNKSTSGKSLIYTAYVADDDILPKGEQVLVKISKNWEALQREYENYGKITKTGLARGQFVGLLDYLPIAREGSAKFRNRSALVLERGSMDLRKYLAKNGPLTGRQLRDAASAAARCLEAVHSSRLVWTDMKSENFVITDSGKIKGIDLESAMPVRDNPVDYSPEATPPEFAKAFLAGDGPYFVLEYNYDMWSYGMLLYELSTGSGYFAGQRPAQITRTLRAGPEIDLEQVTDKRLRELIGLCLNLNPRARPNILQVLLHPYFLTTGFGPISF
ncbi:hypothetical protein MPSEU_000094000 [Mayamaea pseudoterrestris]|nr:hypothetical protein MPSEU_000094000 [Mayamaea pseudoterrestris]